MKRRRKRRRKRKEEEKEEAIRNRDEKEGFALRRLAACVSSSGAQFLESSSTAATSGAAEHLAPKADDPAAAKEDEEAVSPMLSRIANTFLYEMMEMEAWDTFNSNGLVVDLMFVAETTCFSKGLQKQLETRNTFDSTSRCEDEERRYGGNPSSIFLSILVNCFHKLTGCKKYLFICIWVMLLTSNLQKEVTLKVKTPCIN